MSQLRTLCWSEGAERDLNESRQNEGEFESEERAYRRGSWRDSGLKKETLALLVVFISLFGRIILPRMSATFWISSCSNSLNLSDSFSIRAYHLLGKRSRPELSLATDNFPELALTASQR